MRYKEFNRNAVLEKCIPLFWQNGFRTCAISDIVELTGVNRFSLYTEFENKEGILTNAMKLYKERYAKNNLEILKKNESIQATLSEFHESFMTDSDKHPPGCFIIHVATELADEEEDIKQELDAYLLEIEDSIIELLEKTSTSDSKTNKEKAKALVGLFCNTMCFCIVQSKEEQKEYFNTCMNLILNKEHSYV